MFSIEASTLLPSLSLLIFFAGITMMLLEDKLQINKTIPVLSAACGIWVCIAFQSSIDLNFDLLHSKFDKTLLEYAELLLFLVVALVYVEVLTKSLIFDKITQYIQKHRISYRQCFWLSGCMAFALSSIIDNLTAAIIMCAAIINLGKGKPKFVQLSAINIVIAANAGGVFSPFGDITTLMVWQKGMVPFLTFFNLFVPALVKFLIPALVMQLKIPKGTPSVDIQSIVVLKPYAYRSALLFALTLLTTISLNYFLQLPTVMGMLIGLSYLLIYAHIFDAKQGNHLQKINPINCFTKIDWNTLLFFLGLIMMVGALDAYGFLNQVAELLYEKFTLASQGFEYLPANVLIGLLSALIDNIPVMFAVLKMNPDMSQGQWLLVTLTSGVGGSLLSIGSAAGVALMGQCKGIYTFSSHLKWTWIIFIAYGCSIATHMYINQALF